MAPADCGAFGCCRRGGGEGGQKREQKQRKERAVRCLMDSDRADGWRAFLLPLFYPVSPDRIIDSSSVSPLLAHNPRRPPFRFGVGASPLYGVAVAVASCSALSEGREEKKKKRRRRKEEEEEKKRKRRRKRPFLEIPQSLNMHSTKDTSSYSVHTHFLYIALAAHTPLSTRPPAPRLASCFRFVAEQGRIPGRPGERQSASWQPASAHDSALTPALARLVLAAAPGSLRLPFLLSRLAIA